MTMDELDERCEHCRFWKPDGVRSGDCRRFPPTVIPSVYTNPHNGNIVSEPNGAYPYTDKINWCGEFRPGAKA